MNIRVLTDEEMKTSMSLKSSCWTEELAGKAENTMNAERELAFWLSWRDEAEEHDDIRLTIGAFDDDELLGVAFASKAETTDITENGIELNGLWVYEKHRGRGVSLKLLLYIFDVFEGVGMKDMVIYNHHYAPSNKFYTKFGASLMRQDRQSNGQLLIDVFTVSIATMRHKIRLTLENYA